MNSRIINQNEIDILFYEELTQQQINHIFQIIFILAQYIFLTTDMLMKAYKILYGTNMGLSYLKRAVREKLVIEYKEDMDEPSEKDIYYYALKSSTLIYLQQNRIPYIKMPPSAASEEKSRLLTFNKYAIDKEYSLNMQMQLDSCLRYFVTNQSIICYFPDCINQEKIQIEMKNKKNEIEYRFEKITQPLLNVGGFTRATDPRYID